MSATSANLGFGFDTCGLLLADLADVVTLTVRRRTLGEDPHWRLTPHATTPALAADVATLPTDPTRNRVVRAAQTLLRQVWPEAPAHTWAFAHAVGLPVGGGLGSSAAAAWAGAQLMAAWLMDAGLRVSDRQILQAAAAAEGGHWDNLAPLAVGGLAVVMQRPDGVALESVSAPPQTHAWRLVTVTPPQRQATAEARAILPEAIPREACVRQLQAFAQGVLAWQQGQLEAFGFATAIDALATPVRWPTLGGWAEEVKAQWDDLGVPAMWISGAGPTLAALVDNAAQAQRVAQPVAARYPDAMVRISRIQHTPSVVERLHSSAVDASVDGT